MKKLISVLAIMVATSAGAEELSFGDVNYFLKTNQFNPEVGFDVTYQKNRNNGNDALTRGQLITSKYGYGVTDTFNLVLGVDYSARNYTQLNGTTDYKSKGFANPSLAANYRLFNQNQSRYNIDFGAVVRVGVEDAVQGGSKKNGNFANGRDSLELNARMGRKWNEANEWQLAVGAIYNNDGESKAQTALGKNDIEEDASTDFYIRGTYQYRPVKEFMMLVSAQANQVGDFTSKPKVGGVKSESDAHYDFDFNFSAKYLVLYNLIAKFNYGMSRNSDISRKVGGTSSDIERRRENVMGLSVEYLFN